MNMTMEEYAEYLKRLAEKKEPHAIEIKQETQPSKRRRKLIRKQFSKTKRT